MRIAVTAAAVIWILIIGRSVLQPLAVGILVWLVLSALSHRIAALVPARLTRGKLGFRLAGALGTVVLLVTLAVFVGGNVAELGANLSLYEANLDRWMAHAAAIVGETEVVTVASLLGQVDVSSFALSLAGSTASYVAALFVVLSYAVFIFVEAGAVDDKIAALAGDPAREERLRHFLAHVRRGVYDYLSVQTIIGIIQAVPTYLVLLLLGVDAPLFLAVLVFLFSYIPTIGTVIGIAFPTLMALLQFASLGPALIIVGVLGTIQIVSSNVIATQLMSRSLNLSPLVVLFAVFAGGAIWGIVGALIAVPALTIMAIFCAGEPSLRPVAVLLSARGTLPDMDTGSPAATSATVERDPPPQAAE